MMSDYHCKLHIAKCISLFAAVAFRKEGAIMERKHEYQLHLISGFGQLIDLPGYGEASLEGFGGTFGVLCQICVIKV
ncbi:Hypothetical predicted protein [Scomber scombrus]|uniref:Uncharacterized protein n=1 Tax=Scomber scombrus TaxID=13677 RepID=A0AAV1PM05_SCOSC